MTTLRDNPLHAPYYADAGRQIMTDVVENVRVARCTFRLRFPAAEIASRAVPGQFVMLRLSDWNDPLIGRPLAIYDIQPNRHGEPDYI
jgi:dihydroorotate dehydrogenase electron transfer subunit